MSARPPRPPSKFMKNWFAVEQRFSYVIVGTVVTGAAWYTYRLSMGSGVVWTKANPTPWNNVEQGENTKLMAVNQKFEKRFVHPFVTTVSDVKVTNIPPIAQLVAGQTIDCWSSRQNWIVIIFVPSPMNTVVFSTYTLS
ncbi:hypothetical protein BDZ94DRAFT_1152895 [Collybia nuda]|uniref:Uncharacterized protein n=1 Tax=Collybia nuda TaxID=64659 RepID=A0A9P5YGH3_9AGAR|nr:hypothetical protein BDZ94DRAFT_1152895 [Collybia nuda]